MALGLCLAGDGPPDRLGPLAALEPAPLCQGLELLPPGRLDHPGAAVHGADRGGDRLRQPDRPLETGLDAHLRPGPVDLADAAPGGLAIMDGIAVEVNITRSVL